MSLLDNIQNYYESLVVEMLAEHYKGQEVELEFMTDVVCVALNHLPPQVFSTWSGYAVLHLAN